MNKLTKINVESFLKIWQIMKYKMKIKKSLKIKRIMKIIYNSK